MWTQPSVCFGEKHMWIRLSKTGRYININNSENIQLVTRWDERIVENVPVPKELQSPRHPGLKGHTTAKFEHLYLDINEDGYEPLQLRVYPWAGQIMNSINDGLKYNIPGIDISYMIMSERDKKIWDRMEQEVAESEAEYGKKKRYPKEIYKIVNQGGQTEKIPGESKKDRQRDQNTDREME